MDELAPAGAAVTEDDWSAARSRNKRTAYLSCVIGVIVGPLVGLLAVYLTALFATGGRPLHRHGPVDGGARRPDGDRAVVPQREGTGEERRRHRHAGRAVRGSGPGAEIREPPGQRPGHGRGRARGRPGDRTVVLGHRARTHPSSSCWPTTATRTSCGWPRPHPTGSPPACGVDSPDHCPAARRAQVQRFSDSDELDACPKLRGRPEGRHVGACACRFPSWAARSGSSTSRASSTTAFSENTEHDLATLAKLSGARIGLLRVMAETQLQATTDSLTGLLNRRSFEHRVAPLPA